MGSKKKTSSVETENKRLQKENAKLKLQLQKAEAMLDLQKKAASMISLVTGSSDDESDSNS